jgi:hypothetical protein
MKVFIARIKAKIKDPNAVVSLKEVAMLAIELENQNARSIKLTRQVKRGY